MTNPNDLIHSIFFTRPLPPNLSLKCFLLPLFQVPYDFQLTPRAVSGIVVIIILMVLSMLVGGWGIYQKIQAWRHPRSHIQYAPIYMDDNDSPTASSEGLESVGRWSRVEDLGPDSDGEAGQ